MIEFVKANEQHITEIGDLWMEFMRFSQNIDSIHEPPDDSIPIFIEEHLRPAMAAEGSLVLAALDGQHVVGYSYSSIIETSKLSKREKYGYIHDMFVTAKYRRKGLGMRMYSEITGWFHSKDVKRIELGVMTRNQAAASFWEKLGFTDLNRTLYKQL